ncbi:site-specific integrase [Shinella sedimenti]|uniref:Tyrosine-type recombinase/integrase n=1 Tax=Shinella sedimenti TaxID=2919913 RepID=A0ABT0CI78_9HYPH|nr:site-specific integrase [Shinella sedimenti]MCJ8148318.1 tyrosine-type recombinase/integrase [Shinella sedimenti]
MARRSNLIRREGGTYYARIYFPTDLRDHFQSEDKKVSLRTKDETVAKQRLYPELQKWESLFEDIRSRRDVTVNDKAVAVWEHYEATLQQYDRKQLTMPTPVQIDTELQQLYRRIDMGEISSDDFYGMINAYTDYELMVRARADDANLRARRLNLLKEALGSGSTKPVATAARDFITRHRILIDAGSDSHRELCNLLIRAEIEALQRTTERDKGDFTGVPKDPIVKPAAATVREVAAPGETIMELFEVYARENPKSITADTINQARRDIGTFVQHVGTTCPAARIDKKAVREWKALLMKYPVKAAEITAFKGMNIAQIVEHNKAIGKPVLTSRTVNRYLASLGSFCNWLVAHGYIDNNPTSGMSLAKDKRKKVFPFTVEQMNVLFRSPLFTGCESDEAPRFWSKPGSVKIRDHRYWVPLIMLYSGARPAEIAQLAMSDVSEQDDTWIMNITETSDEGEEDLKSVKTLGSRRVVPIHRELERLGFLEYLEETKKAGHTRVFPRAIRNARGQMIAEFSREFSRYLTKLGLKKGRGLSLYSFRHGAVDALRRAGYLDEQFNFIFGHGNGNLVTRGYGVLVQGMLAQRVELVNAIDYPKLKLEHIRV